MINDELPDVDFRIRQHLPFTIQHLPLKKEPPYRIWNIHYSIIKHCITNTRLN